MKKPKSHMHGENSSADEENKVFFQWTDSLSVGIPKIDVQHRTLIGFINDAYRIMTTDGPPDRIKLVLDNLIDYARVHFAYEEKLFLKYAYPESKEHQKEHLDYCNTILDYFTQYHSGAPHVVKQICGYLKDWLYHHIRVSDKKYSAFILTAQKK